MAKTEKTHDMSTNNEKLKALKLTMDKLEKDYGKGSVMLLGEKAETEQEVISTGSIGLDVALGIGGLPRGRIVEIYGPESSGKTTIATHVIAEAQKKGGYEGGRMLFLGLGTGLGSALIADNVIMPMELAHLPYKKDGTFEDYVGRRGLERLR